MWRWLLLPLVVFAEDSESLPCESCDEPALQLLQRRGRQLNLGTCEARGDFWQTNLAGVQAAGLQGTSVGEQFIFSWMDGRFRKMVLTDSTGSKVKAGYLPSASSTWTDPQSWSTNAWAEKNYNILNFWNSCAELSMGPIHGSPATGIAFCGGGFRALGVGIGWLAGMVAATKQPINEVLKVNAIASNSGGSWFTGSLLYSNNFNSMIETMAADPQRAANHFRAEWANRWKQIARKEKTDIPKQVACCSVRGSSPCGTGFNGEPEEIDFEGHQYCCPREILPNGCKSKGSFSCGTWNPMSKGYGLPEAVIFGRSEYCCPSGTTSLDFQKGRGCLDVGVKKNMLQGIGELASTLLWFVFDSKVDYVDIIGDMLEIPGDLNASDPMSSPPVAWARGKDYFVAQSFLTPTEKGVMMAVSQRAGERITSRTAVDSQKVLKSWSCVGSLCGSQVSARFSARLGSQQSPLPITSQAARDALHMEYDIEARRLGMLWHYKVDEAVSPKGVNHWNSSHEIPIKYAVGGSSALLGSLNVLKPALLGPTLRRIVPEWIQSRFTAGEIPFMAQSSSFNMAHFQQARRLLHDPKQFDLPSIAKGHLLEITDAGQIDNTAICHLIAAGHTDVVSIYNTAGFSPGEYSVMKSFHQMLSGKPSTVSAASGYVVFKEDKEEVARQLERFEKIPAVAGATELAAIWAGELHLTTVDSPAHGIDRGHRVTVRMVIVDGQSISCCGSDIDQYAIFAGEIVQTLAAHPAFAKRMLQWHR